MARLKKGECEYFDAPMTYGVFTKEFKEPVMVAPERHYCTEYIAIIPKVLRGDLKIRKLKPDEVKKYSEPLISKQENKKNRRNKCA